MVNPSTTTQERFAVDCAANSHFGTSVALSRDTAIVGAHGEEGGEGAAYVLVRSESTWARQARLVAPDGAAGDWFGTSVSVSGDTAIVGAPGKARNTGEAYAFVRSGSSWTEQAKLVADGGAADDWFGSAVSVSGDTAVVGAFGKSHHAGAVHVFARSGGRWAHEAELRVRGSTAHDWFGGSVRVAGDTILVGAPGTSVSTGAAHVFVRAGGRWAEEARLSAADAAIGDFFGVSVALSGDTALVGADGKSGCRGAAYVFVRRGNRWAQQTKLLAADGAGNDHFGWSVGVSGDTTIIGAPWKASHAGATYLFVRTGTLWRPRVELLAADGTANDFFGWSVGISGETAVAGAYGKSSYAGAAYALGRAGAGRAHQAMSLVVRGTGEDRFTDRVHA